MSDDAAQRQSDVCDKCGERSDVCDERGESDKRNQSGEQEVREELGG